MPENMNFGRTWQPALKVVLLQLLVVLLVTPGSDGEMRKSWQTKTVDVQSQLLKSARLEEPPSAKPPDTASLSSPIVAETEGSSEPFGSQTSGTEQSKPPVATPAAKAIEVQGSKTAQFSSRVRNKYGLVKPASGAAKPIDQAGTSTIPTGRDRAELDHLEPNLDEIQVDDATVQDDDDDDDDEEDEEEDDLLGWGEQVTKHGKEYDLIENILEEVDGRVKQEKRPKAESHSEAEEVPERTKEYTFPPVLNMTIDEPNNTVRIKLNQDVVRDMLSTARDGGGGIGGKKMLRYILPLFILPFLIQSAVIPFMLTAVKLFLLKSLMAGKVAIFLLLLGAFKNFTKKESRDVYVKDVPDRRYEPSSEGFAYLAEGRPSDWVN